MTEFPSVEQHVCLVLSLSLWYKIHESNEKGARREAGRDSV